MMFEEIVAAVSDTLEDDMYCVQQLQDKVACQQ